MAGKRKYSEAQGGSPSKKSKSGRNEKDEWDLSAVRAQCAQEPRLEAPAVCQLPSALATAEWKKDDNGEYTEFKRRGGHFMNRKIWEPAGPATQNLVGEIYNQVHKKSPRYYQNLEALATDEACLVFPQKPRPTTTKKAGKKGKQVGTGVRAERISSKTFLKIEDISDQKPKFLESSITLLRIPRRDGQGIGFFAEIFNPSALAINGRTYAELAAGERLLVGPLEGFNIIQLHDVPIFFWRDFASRDQGGDKKKRAIHWASSSVTKDANWKSARVSIDIQKDDDYDQIDTSNDDEQNAQSDKPSTGYTPVPEEPRTEKDNAGDQGTGTAGAPDAALMEAELHGLKEELDEAKQRSSQLAVDGAEARRKVENLTAELDAANKKINELENDTKGLKSSLGASAAENRNYQNLKQELSGVKLENERLTAALKDANKRKASVEAKNEECQKELERLRAEVKRLKEIEKQDEVISNLRAVSSKQGDRDGSSTNTPAPDPRDTCGCKCNCNGCTCGAAIPRDNGPDPCAVFRGVLPKQQVMAALEQKPASWTAMAIAAVSEAVGRARGYDFCIVEGEVSTAGTKKELEGIQVAIFPDRSLILPLLRNDQWFLVVASWNKAKKVHLELLNNSATLDVHLDDPEGNHLFQKYLFSEIQEVLEELRWPRHPAGPSHDSEWLSNAIGANYAWKEVAKTVECSQIYTILQAWARIMGLETNSMFNGNNNFYIAAHRVIALAIGGHMDLKTIHSFLLCFKFINAGAELDDRLRGIGTFGMKDYSAFLDRMKKHRFGDEEENDDEEEIDAEEESDEEEESDAEEESGAEEKSDDDEKTNADKKSDVSRRKRLLAQGEHNPCSFVAHSLDYRSKVTRGADRAVLGQRLTDSVVMHAITAVTEALTRSKHSKWSFIDPVRLATTRHSDVQVRNGRLPTMDTRVMRHGEAFLLPYIYNKAETALQSSKSAETASQALQEATEEAHIFLVYLRKVDDGIEMRWFDSMPKYLQSHRKGIRNHLATMVRYLEWFRYGTRESVNLPNPQMVEVPTQNGDWSCGLHTILNAWATALGLEINPQTNITKEFYEDAVEIINLALVGHMDVATIVAFLRCHDYILDHGDILVNPPFKRTVRMESEQRSGEIWLRLVDQFNARFTQLDPKTPPLSAPASQSSSEGV